MIHKRSEENQNERVSEVISHDNYQIIIRHDLGEGIYGHFEIEVRSSVFPITVLNSVAFSSSSCPCFLKILVSG